MIILLLTFSLCVKLKDLAGLAPTKSVLGWHLGFIRRVGQKWTQRIGLLIEIVFRTTWDHFSGRKSQVVPCVGHFMSANHTRIGRTRQRRRMGRKRRRRKGRRRRRRRGNHQRISTMWPSHVKRRGWVLASPSILVKGWRRRRWRRRRWALKNGYFIRWDLFGCSENKFTKERYLELGNGTKTFNWFSKSCSMKPFDHSRVLECTRKLFCLVTQSPCEDKLFPPSFEKMPTYVSWSGERFDFEIEIAVPLLFLLPLPIPRVRFLQRSRNWLLILCLFPCEKTSCPSFYLSIYPLSLSLYSVPQSHLTQPVRSKNELGFSFNFYCW